MDTFTTQMGDKFIYEKNGLTYTVHAILSAGSAGTKVSDGPHVKVHLRPGGHSLTVVNNGYPAPADFIPVKDEPEGEPELTHEDCLNHPTADAPAERQCEGAVEYRMPLSGTGKSFLRCDRHWDERLKIEDRTRSRYGHPDSAMPPSDFDPSYAGESWDGE